QAGRVDWKVDAEGCDKIARPRPGGEDDVVSFDRSVSSRYSGDSFVILQDPGDPHPGADLCAGSLRGCGIRLGGQRRVGVAIVCRVGARHDVRRDAGCEVVQVLPLDERDIQPERALGANALAGNGHVLLPLVELEMPFPVVMDVSLELVLEVLPPGNGRDRERHLARVPALLAHATGARARRRGGNRPFLDQGDACALPAKMPRDRAPYHATAADDHTVS